MRWEKKKKTQLQFYSISVHPGSLKFSNKDKIKEIYSQKTKNQDTYERRMIVPHSPSNLKKCCQSTRES